METSLKRQEGDMCALSVWFKEAQSKDLDTRCKEMESGLENERQARARDNQYEADELQERFDQHTLATQTQLESGQTQLDDECKQRMEMERRSKNFESQLLEFRLKIDEQSRKLQELQFTKGRLQTVCTDYNRHLEEIESKVTNASHLESQYFSQAEELKRVAGEEQHEKQAFGMNIKNLQHELEQLKETLEDGVVSRFNLLRQLALKQSDAQQWRRKFEGEVLVSDGEIDELRRKQLVEIAELQNEIDVVNARLQSMEKQRARLVAEADNGRADVASLAQQAHQLENRQKAHEKQVEEWRHQSGDLQSELGSVQREARMQAIETHRLESAQDSLQEQVDGLRRENRQLNKEFNDLQGQQYDSQRAVNELKKLQLHLEGEKDELKHVLNEVDVALEAEKGRVLRTQVELSQIRVEIEQETNAKAELARVKKKLEADVNELELTLEHANCVSEDVQKNIRRYGDQCKEFQAPTDDDQRRRTDFREKFLSTEKCYQSLKKDYEELSFTLETTQRFKKQLGELNELQTQNVKTQVDSQSLLLTKQKLEQELALIRADLNEVSVEVLARQKRAKNGSMLAEEPSAEQERSNSVERQKKMLETQDMQMLIEETEKSAIKAGPKLAAKLEVQLKAVEGELENEQRRKSYTVKNASKAERLVRDLQFKTDEEHKNYEKFCDLADKLQAKIRNQKMQLEETEELAGLSLQKYKLFQLSVDSVEESAQIGENSLALVRSRSRLNFTQQREIHLIEQFYNLFNANKFQMIYLFIIFFKMIKEMFILSMLVFIISGAPPFRGWKLAEEKCCDGLAGICLRPVGFLEPLYCLPIQIVPDITTSISTTSTSAAPMSSGTSPSPTTNNINIIIYIFVSTFIIIFLQKLFCFIYKKIKSRYSTIPPIPPRTSSTTQGTLPRGPNIHAPIRYFSNESGILRSQEEIPL